MWINTDDALPVPGRRVLVWGGWSRDGVRCPVAWLRRSLCDVMPFWTREDGCSACGLTHWWDGPLPGWAVTPPSPRPLVLTGGLDPFAEKPEMVRRFEAEQAAEAEGDGACGTR